MTNTHLLIMVLVAGACTFATRLFPFALFGAKASASLCSTWQCAAGSDPGHSHRLLS